MFRILFICTDNIGRSLTAQYILRDWLEKNNRHDIEVCSAGIDATSNIGSFCMAHRDKLKEKGIDTSDHCRTQLTKYILDTADMAIAMDETQRTWIKEKFGETVPLYNEIYKNESSSVFISPPGSTGTMEEKCRRMVEYFEKSMSEFMEQVDETRLK